VAANRRASFRFHGADLVNALRHARVAELRPTARGAGLGFIVVALGLSAAFGDTATLALFLVLLGLPLLAAPVIALVRARRAAHVHVAMMVSPPLVPVGGPCSLVVHLVNERQTVLPPLGLDRPTYRSSAATRRRPLAPGFDRLIAWDPAVASQEYSSTLALPTGRRGVFSIGPLTLRAYDPFGLCSLPVAVSARVTLVVHPAWKVAPAQAALSPIRTGGEGFTEDLSAARHDDPGGELSGLRPYVPGDRLHLLSWSAEARYGSLMVHEFQSPASRRVRITLDDRAGVHRRAAFEDALAVVYTLATEAVGGGLDVEFTTLSGGATVVTTAPDGLVDLLTALASAQPVRVAVPAAALDEVSALVTTSTAQDSLPAIPGDPDVVVAE
jgi:uncharacterized protein (DUF58 family)